MAIARFRDPAGSVRTGEYDGTTVSAAGRTHALEEITLLPPCEPAKLICVGRNYAAHAEERDEAVPERPLLFLKPPNSLAPHGATVTLPTGKERIDQEAELAVVIGEQCRNVAVDDAMDVVAGYTAGMDLSNRDDQRAEQNWVRGKAFDNSSPLGPAIVEDVASDAAIECRVDGEVRQASTIDHFIFSIPELIADVTTYLTLEPGDVILTGTPEGVADLPDGATVEVDIEGIPTLAFDVDRPDR